MATIMKIKEIDFNSESDPFVIGQLYKTYVRPSLTYGLENISLLTNELDRICTFESNSIKVALGLPIRIHSKDLLGALGIDHFTNRLKLLQTSLFSRLLDDEFTKEFIKEIFSTCRSNLHPRSLLRDMTKYMTQETTISNLATRCRQTNACLKSSFKMKCKSSPTIARIKTFLKNKDCDGIVASCIAFI